VRMLHRRINCLTLIWRRQFGGMITDSELTAYGLELYREMHGPIAIPPRDFVIPATDPDGHWPHQLRGRALGHDVVALGLVAPAVVDSKVNPKQP
jgi:hypothetical protein